MNDAETAGAVGHQRFSRSSSIAYCYRAGHGPGPASHVEIADEGRFAAYGPRLLSINRQIAELLVKILRGANRALRSGVKFQTLKKPRQKPGD
jgi:hypothetical protein